MDVTQRPSRSTNTSVSSLPSRNKTALQIAESLTSPGSILFKYRERPFTQGPTHVRTRSDDMDKRHPSSFQQLEKVIQYHLTVGATHTDVFSCSWEKEHMQQYVHHVDNCPEKVLIPLRFSKDEIAKQANSSL